MKLKESLENRIRGWLPKEQSIGLANKPLKPRWRSPYWITFTLVVAVALAGVVYFGVNTYLIYTSPLMVVTVSYYEKTVKATTVEVGDIIEVKVRVGWHGYVIPEFKRDVKVVDAFPESYFALVNGSNVYEYKGYGGSDQFAYDLKVIAEGNGVELPEPRLYLDNVEIPLDGVSPTLNITSK
jgi:hypothetical protein